MWIHGDAMALPFPNNSFDAYSIVFGIRNVANIQQVLKYVYMYSTIYVHTNTEQVY